MGCVCNEIVQISVGNVYSCKLLTTLRIVAELVVAALVSPVLFVMVCVGRTFASSNCSCSHLSCFLKW